MAEGGNLSLHAITDDADTWVHDLPGERRLTVTWPDGQESAFHYVWLRHAARCPGGMPNDAVNKLELLPDDPASLTLRGVELEGGVLRLRWSDDALTTEHHLEDLKAAAYDKERRAARYSRPRLWDRSRSGAIPGPRVRGAARPGEAARPHDVPQGIRSHEAARCPDRAGDDQGGRQPPRAPSTSTTTARSST